MKKIIPSGLLVGIIFLVSFIKFAKAQDSTQTKPKEWRISINRLFPLGSFANVYSTESIGLGSEISVDFPLIEILDVTLGMGVNWFDIGNRFSYPQAPVEIEVNPKSGTEIYRIMPYIASGFKVQIRPFFIRGTVQLIASIETFERYGGSSFSNTLQLTGTRIEAGIALGIFRISGIYNRFTRSEEIFRIDRIEHALGVQIGIGL